MATACTIGDLIADLHQYPLDEFVLCELWFKDDVLSIDQQVTAAEVQATLIATALHFDASCGISWGALAHALSCIRDD